MKLIIASNNAHKLEEIRAILGSSFDEILSLREAGIEHETVEDGRTFAENAAKKAREIAEISGCCALGDDSGICVDALGGATTTVARRGTGLSPARSSWRGCGPTPTANSNAKRWRTGR